MIRSSLLFCVARSFSVLRGGRVSFYGLCPHFGTGRQTDSLTHWQTGAFKKWFNRIVVGPRIGSLSVYGSTSKRSLSTIQNFNCLLIWYYLLTPCYKRFFFLNSSTYKIFDNLSISKHCINIEASLSIVCMNCCKL